MAALREANRVRVVRARVKSLISAGVLQLADVLSNPMPDLFSMKTLDLLRAAPKVGPVKAARLLKQCAISNHKTVGGMSPRQRGELVRVLMGDPSQS